MFQTEQEQKMTPDENLAFSKFPVLKTKKTSPAAYPCLKD